MKQIVLMYHDIYRQSPAESGFQNSTAIKYKVSADSFEQQVSSINNYLRERKLPLTTVKFTFNDGGISFLTEAAPILEKYGFRGLFFISTSYIGSDKFLGIEDIRELTRRGHVVGSHSHTHPDRLTALSPEELDEEWKYSQMVLTEILGETSCVASIPNGYSSEAVLCAMNQEGITDIYSSTPTTTIKKFKNSKTIGRYVVTGNDDISSVLSIISSPIYRFKLNVRFKCLGLAKAILGDTYLKIRTKIIK